MKDSGVEWIGEIPFEWDVTILSALFGERKHKNHNLEETNLLSLSYGQIKRKSIETNEGLLPASFETYNIIEDGDIVFRLTDLQNDKRSLRTGLCKERGIITSAYVTLAKKANDDPSYMHYLFHSYDICKVFYGMGDGVRQGMNYINLKSLRVIRPPYTQQVKIGDYLTRKCAQIDAVIVRQQEAIEKLKAYKASVITDKVAPREGWLKGHLGYLATFKNGLNYNGISADSEIKFLGVGDFQHHFKLDSADMFSTLKFSGDMPEDLLLQNGDIVFVRSNGSKELVGRSVLIDNVDYPLTYSGFCIRMRNLRQDIALNEFLLYCFWSHDFRQNLNRDSRGSNINNLNQELLSKLEVALPSLETQREIVQYLDQKCESIENAIQKKQRIAEKLLDYKKSLIYEVVTGKREV